MRVCISISSTCCATATRPQPTRPTCETSIRVTRGGAAAVQVNYKNVMSEYKLGPNGGILTACNLFATRFDQVMALCEKERAEPLETIVVDTAGQIEIFTWSASGTIITELLASSFPTVVLYVIDTPRCLAPQTFMSNMMQACSILYKTQLPMILVRSRPPPHPCLCSTVLRRVGCEGCTEFRRIAAYEEPCVQVYNKVDVTRHDLPLKWMKDFDAFQRALDSDDTYAASLAKSLSLVLDEFYENLTAVGVSSVTGEGMQDLFAVRFRVHWLW